MNHTKIFRIKNKRRLPANARLFTANAISMYTNINTEHALQVLEWFLNELKTEGHLDDNFNIKIIVEASALIMRWNLFEYGYVILSGS